MNKGWLLLVCILCWTVWGSVLELTDANFDAMIKNSSIIMVKFFAPWCGHCKTLAPEYERAAQLIQDQGKSYVLGELDATVHSKAANRHNIQGYPTVILFLHNISDLQTASSAGLTTMLGTSLVGLSDFAVDS